MPKTPKPEPKSDELEKKPYEPTRSRPTPYRRTRPRGKKTGLALR